LFKKDKQGKKKRGEIDLKIFFFIFSDGEICNLSKCCKSFVFHSSYYKNGLREADRPHVILWDLVLQKKSDLIPIVPVKHFIISG